MYPVDVTSTCLRNHGCGLRDRCIAPAHTCSECCGKSAWLRGTRLPSQVILFRSTNEPGRTAGHALSERSQASKQLHTYRTLTEKTPYTTITSRIRFSDKKRNGRRSSAQQLYLRFGFGLLASKSGRCRERVGFIRSGHALSPPTVQRYHQGFLLSNPPNLNPWRLEFHEKNACLGRSLVPLSDKRARPR